MKDSRYDPVIIMFLVAAYFALVFVVIVFFMGLFRLATLAGG